MPKVSLRIIPGESGYRFDRENICTGFYCTAQRTVATMLTETGTDRIFPAQTSQLPKIPGMELSLGVTHLQHKLASIAHNLVQVQAPVSSEEEYLQEVILTPSTASSPDQLNVIAYFKAKENSIVADI